MTREFKNASVALSGISSNKSEWLAIRQKTIGSSDISTVCGLNNWKTPYALWLEKTGRTMPEPENDAMWLGTQLEPVIAQLFAKTLDKQIEKCDALYRSSIHDFATASPDYFVLEGDAVEICEVKNSSFSQKQHWGNDVAPVHAHMQLIWQLGILGLKNGYVAGLVGGSVKDFHTPHFAFEPVIFDQMMVQAEKFIWHVKADKEPELRGEDLKQFTEKIVRVENKQVDLPVEAKDALAEYRVCREQIEKLEGELDTPKKRLDNAKARLIKLMGDAEIGFCDGAKVVAKKVVKQPYTTKLSTYTSFKVVEMEGA